MAPANRLLGMARGEDFQLSTNEAGSGNFDDLPYTTRTRRYLQQLKHNDNPDTTKLVPPGLVPFRHKFFQSLSIIQNPTIKDIPLEKSESINYTNQQLEPKWLQHNRQQRVTDVICKTCNTGETFNFTPDENKETYVYTLIGKLVKESKEFSDLSPPERKVKQKRNTEYSKKLILVTGQKGQRELDDVNNEEIRQHDAVIVGPQIYNMESHCPKMLSENLLRNKEEKVTAETTRNSFQEAGIREWDSDIRNFSDSFRKKHYGTGITFSDSEVSRVLTELSDKRAVHLKSDALTLCSILLLDCLDTSKCIFVPFESMQSNKNMLLDTWLGGNLEWFIVLCDSKVKPNDISSTRFDIYRRPVPLNKRVIIFTKDSVEKIDGFCTIDHKFKFEQLSYESQEKVLDKKIEFQGCEVTMRSVLLRHGNVEHVLGPELVTDMITEETSVQLGGMLQMNKGDYEPSVLKRQIYMPLDVLKNSDSYPDIFAVSGMEKKELVKTVPSYEIVGKFCLDKDPETGIWIEKYNKFKMSRFIKLKSKNLRLCFSKLCEKHSGKTLHWLDLKEGCLLWKESRGSIESLINYVDPERTCGDKRIITEFMKSGSCEVREELISNLSERTVLVVAESGMGKSRTTTHVAWNTKLADPTSWVVRINWNDHTRKLESINAARFNLDSLVEFLCSAAFAKSKYTDINRSLLKEALENGGNVTVLMDGFDEISPTYEDKAAVILSALMKTKVARVWVTSCPAQREWLEKELSVVAFTLKKLSQVANNKAS